MCGDTQYPLKIFCPLILRAHNLLDNITYSTVATRKLRYIA